MLFDEIVRADASPMRYGEGSFEFLNRSARPEIARVREFVKSCIAAYPSLEVHELIARLRSSDDTQFASATFELLLYSALIRLGFTLEPHRELRNGAKTRPDYLVSAADVPQFYLEAVLASEIRPRGGEAIKGTVMDALTAARHSSFTVVVMEKGRPTTQPSGKKLTKAVLKWLDSLDPDKVKEILDREGSNAISPFVWEHEGWSLTIRPIPVDASRRGKTGTFVSGFIGAVGWVNAWAPIGDAVKFKGSKYGQLDLPLLVAVNADTFAFDARDEMQALYGQETYVVAVEDEARGEPLMRRLPNGAWNGPEGPRYTRVSGAWIFSGISPYTVASRRNTVYLNPSASKRLPESVLVLPHAKADGEEIKWTDGKSFREIFGLHDRWPQEDRER